MNALLQELNDELTALKRQHLYRTRRIIDSPQQALIRYQGRELINFCSNNYLGLANHPQVVKAFQRSAGQYGVGSGSAHLICGHNREHHALEEALAEFTGYPKALLFSTGYMANLAVLTSLIDKRDAVFEDRLNHASLLDGGLFSGARFKRYPHRDAQCLADLLEAADSSRRKLIVSDGVFSMDGSIAPSPQLADIAQQHQAWLMLDDAHGFGVLGENGAGSVAHFRLSSEDIPIYMATLGKALGVFGAFVAGSETLIDFLIQRGRTFIYTTALPPAVAAAGLAGLKLLSEESWRRHKLNELVKYFRFGAGQLGLQLMPSDTAIQPVLIGDSEKALKVSEQLLAHGIWISAIRPPTVAKGQARLRITFSAEHQTAHVDRLLQALERVIL